MKKFSLFLASAILFSASAYCEETQTSNADASQKQQQEEKIVDETPVFSVGGEAKFNTSNTTNKHKYLKSEANPTDKDSSMMRINAEANLDCRIKGQLANGMFYGARIDIDTIKGDTGADKMYVSFGHDSFGEMHVGNLKGPECSFKQGGQELLGATTGADGTVPHDLDYATGCIDPVNVLGNSSKATKIFYATPTFYGLQFGVAFTPDTKQIGHQDRNRNTGASGTGNDTGIYSKAKGETEKPSARNHIALALRYNKELSQDWSCGASFAFITDNARDINIITYNTVDNTTADEKIKVKNTKAFITTGFVKYKKFTLGGGYFDNGKSRLPVAKTYEGKDTTFIPGGFIATKDSNAGKAYNIGMKYELTEKIDLATCYHHTWRKITKEEKAKMDIVSFTVDYKLCDGFKFYGEVDYVNSKSGNKACEMYNKAHGSNDAIKKTKSWLFALGAKVTF